MPFLAGQKVRVSQLNELGGGGSTAPPPTGGGGGGGTGALPTGGYAMATADRSVTNSTTLVEATGLTFDLAASATYAFHGWLIYTGPTTAGIKVRPGAPAGASGYWSLIGPPRTQTPVAGSPWLNYADFFVADLNSSQESGCGGTSQRIAQIFQGYVTTTGAGQLQVLVAQAVADAAATILRAGSWLRVVRMA